MNNMYEGFLGLGNEQKVLVLAVTISLVIGFVFGIRYYLARKGVVWMPSFGKKTTVAQKLRAFKKMFASLQKKVRRLLAQKKKLEVEVADLTAADQAAAVEIEKLIAEGEALIAELDAKP